MLSLPKFSTFLWMAVLLAALFGSPSRVLATPSNDNFVNAISIGGSSSSITGTNVGSSLEAGEPHRGLGKTVWYRWAAPFSNGATFTVTSTARLYIRIYTGPAVTILTEVNYNEKGSSTSSTYTYSRTINAISGTAYLVQVQDYSSNYPGEGDFTLSWHPGPVNDNFVNAITIGGQNSSIIGTNVDSSLEVSEPHRGIGETVWYRWSAPFNNGATFTVTSSARLFISIYTGSALNNLTEVSYTDMSSSTSSSYTYSRTINAVVGTNYIIQVQDYSSNYPGEGDFQLTWPVDPNAPTNDNFVNALVIDGQSGSMPGTNVESSFEIGEPAYEIIKGYTVWYRWTAPASGGATFSLASGSRLWLRAYKGSALTNLLEVKYHEKGAGTTAYSRTFNAVAGTTYFIQVQDWNTETGSFTLNWQPGPANDNFAAAQALTGASIDISGTNVNASVEAGELPLDGAGNNLSSESVWYRWTAPANGPAAFTLTSTGPLLCRVFTGAAVNGLSQPDHTDKGTGTIRFTTAFTAVAGTTYSIQIADSNNNPGTFRLYGGLAPVNDLFANAAVLTGSAGRITAVNLPASLEPGEPMHAGVAGGASIWYRWVAPVSGNVVFTTAGSDFDTLLGVYTGANVNGLTAMASSDNDTQGVNGSSRLMFRAVGGTAYYIAVDGKAGATGNVVLRWLPPVNTFDVESAGGSDVLLQNSQSRQLLYWTLKGTSFVGYNFLSPADPGPGWNVVGTADLNNDGKPDVVFQHQTTGKLGYWTLNGPQAFNIALLGDPGSPDWKVVSLTDLDGDGKPDILFQNQKTGNLIYWLMDGVNQRSSGALNPLNPGTSWKVVGAADFNGDDKVDLLFQNTQTGALVYWLMDGVNLITFGPLNPSLPGAGWSVVSLTDFNGDGQADVLFQNQQTGQLAYWLMVGVHEVTIGLLTDPGTPNWKVVSSH